MNRCSKFLRQIVISAFNSKRDLRRLKERMPVLQNFSELERMHRQKLKPYYEEYISKISLDQMAISLELSVFLMILCDTLKPNNLLDLGSGFSSFVFRNYMLNAPMKPQIYSIDDSKEWLDKTRTFLAMHKLSTENMSTWRSFSEDNNETFDLILYDLGSMDMRKEMLKDVLDRARPGGAVVLDDIHKRDYKSYINKVLIKSNLQCCTLEPFTKDRFGRYAMLVFF